MSKRYYIAYGSNLSREQMAFRTPDAKIVGTAILYGWQLLFRLHATIRENREKNTPVLVWEISKEDEKRLDRYEGYPQIYRRYTVDVILDDGTELPALIYEMTPKTKEIRNGLPYPEEYRKICREGANLHRIKNHFIRKRRRK